MVSGNRLQRGIGRLLGDDTWRYRAARVVGRPLLRLYRSATGRQKRVVPRDARVVAPVDPDLAFPINYQPQPLATLKISFEADHRFASVLVVELDDDAPPAQASDQLNDALAATDTTWILVLDRSATPTERVATTRLLLDHALTRRTAPPLEAPLDALLAADAREQPLQELLYAAPRNDALTPR